jgi:hypothetical protein
MYFTIPETPGVEYFGCEKLRAKFPVAACAEMWRKANHGTPDERELRSACKNCPIGATHSGEPTTSISPLRNARICGRCQRPSRRLISKHLCVSCQNRQYEWLKGSNAKGCSPSRMRPLAARSFHFAHDGVRRETYLPLSVDPDELIIAALRDSAGRVGMGRNGHASHFRRIADAVAARGAS